MNDKGVLNSINGPRSFAVALSAAAVLISSLFHAQAVPTVRNVEGPTPVGPGANKPSIAADGEDQPHIAVMSGGTTSPWVLYEKPGSAWQTSTLDLGDFYGYADQYNNPHIEIDWTTGRAWLSGIMVRIGSANGTGMGIFTWQNSTSRSFGQARGSGGVKFFRDWVMPYSAGWPVGYLSIDQVTQNNCYIGVTGGYWDEIAASAGNDINIVAEGHIVSSKGNESTGFWASKAGEVSHGDGSTRAVLHKAITGHPAFGDGFYHNSIRNTAGQGETPWYDASAYPQAKAYTACRSDNLDPERAYIAIPSHDGRGIIMNIWDGSSMLFPINNLLQIGSGSASMGSPDERYQVQMAPAKNGGVFVCYQDGGRVKVQYVGQDGSKPWGEPVDIGPGYYGTVCTDTSGNVHVAFMADGQTKYAKIVVNAVGTEIITMAADFDGDGIHDPAEFNSSRGTLFVVPGMIGFGREISLPFVQPGDLPVFADFDGNPSNGVEIGVANPAEGRWAVYNGDEFATYDPGNLWSINNFGSENDYPVAGDFDGDTYADIGLFRTNGAMWYIQGALGHGYSGPTGFSFGNVKGIPLCGNWNTNAGDEIVIWHPEEKTYNIYGGNFWNDDSSAQIGDVDGEDYPVPADYDGDDLLDFAVFRPQSGEWFTRRSADGEDNAQMGADGDVPAPGKYDPDNKADLTVIRSGEWIIRPTDPDSPDPYGRAPVDFGMPWALPAPADYNGDGEANLAVFDQLLSYWYIQGMEPIQFGPSGSIPVPADWDNDGQADIGVFYPPRGAWYIWRSTDGPAQWVFGSAADIPAPADYDGDGQVDVGVYRRGVWFMWGSTDGAMSDEYGTTGYTPVPADWNDDGSAEIAIHDVRFARWGLDRNDPFVSWGPAGAIACPDDYDGDGDVDMAVYDQGWWWIDEADGLRHGSTFLSMPGAGDPVGAFPVQ
jgi:hypothetical protein